MATYKDPGTAGSAGLTYGQYADDIVWCHDAIVALQGGTPVNLSAYVPQFAASADGSALVVTVNGVVVSTIPFPSGSGFKGAYTIGATYAQGNTFSYNGNAYIAAKTFTASTFAADTAAGRVALFAARGAPAVNNRGAYNTATTYSVGDGCTTADASGLLTYWVLLATAPAGTAPASGSAYWSIVATGSPIPSTQVKDATQGLLLSVIIANFAAAITALQAQSTKSVANISAINTQLGNAKIAGFPLALAT